MKKRGEGHHYVSYYDGAVHYDLPYLTFVHLAKEAGATVELHKSAIADTNTVDQYLDEHCLVPADKIKEKESEREMKRRLQDIEKIRNIVLIDTQKIDKFIEAFQLEDEEDF